MGYWSVFVTVCVFVTPLVLAQDYRIPDTVVPSNYEIELFLPQTVFTGANTTFEGEVSITFTVTTTTSEINFHHRNSSNTIQQLTLTDSVGNDISTYNDTWNSVTEIYTIQLESNLTVGSEYILNILYYGTLAKDTMVGFYISTYKDEDGVETYMVLSKFEPVHARHAFPCFDEPQFKATFDLTLTYPSDFNALANTVVSNETSTVIDSVSYTTTKYQQTTIMSTYLLAFAISQFTCTEGYSFETNVPHSVCSRPEEEPYRKWAVDVGTSAMRSMESTLGIKFGEYMPKMHQLAIPDFASGAMENWGLVSYREAYLLWDEDESSNSYKKSIAAVVAHEFAHSWFGNLVTCQWWDYIFLNEAFARYFQYMAGVATKEMVDWEMDKHFNVEVVHVALLTDSDSDALAIVSEANSPSEISAKFGTISYSKGASILRMIEKNIMGADNFVYGMREYLVNNSQKATVPSDLWEAFANHVPSEALPLNIDFETVITNWTELNGHPVVQVTRDGDDLVLTQERFVLSGNSTNEYYVPITYTLSSDTSKFTNTTVKRWLVPGETLTLSGVMANSSWVVLNNRQAGFYRVDYDSTLWESIKTQLQENHLKIDVLNRAQIISDSYNFARSGSQSGYGDWSYADTLDILSYLEDEDEYYPWYAAIVGNNHLLTRIGYDSEIGQQFTTWMIQLMTKVYKSVPFDTVDESNMVYSLKQNLILNRMCKYGEETCVAQAIEYFANYRDNGVKVPKNLRIVVYCNALRYSDNVTRDFNFLWEKYTETNLMTEVITMYAGLACAEDIELLKWYLGQTINSTSGIRLQDFTSVWSYVYSSSKVGTNAAIEYITENYDEFTAAYSSVGSLISNAASYIYDEDQLAYLEALAVVVEGISGYNNTVNSAIDTAKSNIEFAETLAADVQTYLDSLTSAVPSFKPTFISIACLLVVMSAVL